MFIYLFTPMVTPWCAKCNAESMFFLRGLDMTIDDLWGLCLLLKEAIISVRVISIVGHTIMLSWEMPSKNFFLLILLW